MCTQKEKELQNKREEIEKKRIEKIRVKQKINLRMKKIEKIVSEFMR